VPLLCLRDGSVSELFRPHRSDINKSADGSGNVEEAKQAASALAPAQESWGGSTPSSGGPSGVDQPPLVVGGQDFPWTRTLGDLDVKKSPEGAGRLFAQPDVRVVSLDSSHQGVALVSWDLYKAIGSTSTVSTIFSKSGRRPRFAAGALVDNGLQSLGEAQNGHLGALALLFDQVKNEDIHPAKKAKSSQPAQQVRARHILLKHRECKAAHDKVRHKQVKRTRGEAERMMRNVLEQCAADTTKKLFTQKCKELSECTSCLSAGDLAGDVGWMKLGKGKFGAQFDAVAFALQVGELSDLVDSDQGIHIILRSA